MDHTVLRSVHWCSDPQLVPPLSEEGNELMVNSPLTCVVQDCCSLGPVLVQQGVAPKYSYSAPGTPQAHDSPETVCFRLQSAGAPGLVEGGGSVLQMKSLIVCGAPAYSSKQR